MLLAQYRRIAFIFMANAMGMVYANRILGAQSPVPEWLIVLCENAVSISIYALPILIVVEHFRRFDPTKAEQTAFENALIVVLPLAAMALTIVVAASMGMLPAAIGREIQRLAFIEIGLTFLVAWTLSALSVVAGSLVWFIWERMRSL